MSRFLQIALALLVACTHRSQTPAPTTTASPLPLARDCRMVLCSNQDYPWPWDSLQPWVASQELLADSAIQSWGLTRDQISRLSGDPNACVPLLASSPGPLLIAINGHLLENGDLLLPDRRRVSLRPLLAQLASRRGDSWLIVDTCHAGLITPPAGSKLRILSVCRADQLSRDIRLSATRLPTLRRDAAEALLWLRQERHLESVSPLGLCLARLHLAGWPPGGFDAKLAAIVEQGDHLNALPGFGNQDFDLQGIPPDPTGR